MLTRQIDGVGLDGYGILIKRMKFHRKRGIVMTFTQVKPEELGGNIFKVIGQDWMLISAGDEKAFNTMTASWGGVGVLWSRNVAFCFIRPQRYTLEFVNQNDRFSLSFFGGGHRDALNLCGSKSGREIDKAKAAGLTPVFADGTVYFEEASTVLVCQKLYFHDFDPKYFLDSAIAKNYAAGDYHRMFIGGIEKAYVKA